MLYVNTNNKFQTYTAFQALHTDLEINDGVIAPLRLPVFSKKDLDKIYHLSPAAVISYVLRKFFYTEICVPDLEAIMADAFCSVEELDRKTLLVNIVDDFEKFENDVFNLLCQEDHTPSIWVRCAIRISVFTAIIAELRRNGLRKLDFAVNSDEICSIIPVLYCKIMGLPIEKIIIGASHEEGIWKYLHMCLEGTSGSYDYFLHGLSFVKDPKRFLNDLVSYIVSATRAGEIAANIKHSHGNFVTLGASFSYGALQDHRAITGENGKTIVFNA